MEDLHLGAAHPAATITVLPRGIDVWPCAESLEAELRTSRLVEVVDRRAAGPGYFVVLGGEVTQTDACENASPHLAGYAAFLSQYGLAGMYMALPQPLWSLTSPTEWIMSP